ncbi:MAG: rhomboid family intramembrane serine protease [Oceanospirillaceae bacterium]|nr:rhomboid family intramembrane serine protease [Oceanospirillaceae bacterium]
MPVAFSYPKRRNVKPLLYALQQRNIDYRLIERQGVMECWVADEKLARELAQIYEQYAQQQRERISLEGLYNSPVTAVCMLLSILFTLYVWLGGNLERLYIADMVYYPRSWYWSLDLEHLLRLFTPTFMHFGLEHLVFNLISLWFLGNKLEAYLGRTTYILFILLVAAFSNIAQLWVSGPLFGGFSGVVYGLLGACGFYQFYVHANLNVPKGFYILAIIWLLLGVFDVFAMLGMAQMANTAHIAGLAAGLLLAVLIDLFRKIQGITR